MTPSIAFVVVNLVCTALGCSWEIARDQPNFSSEQACEAAAAARDWIGACTVQTIDEIGGPWDLIELGVVQSELGSGTVSSMSFEMELGFVTKQECDKAARREQLAHRYEVSCVRAHMKD